MFNQKFCFESSMKTTYKMGLLRIKFTEESPKLNLSNQKISINCFAKFWLVNLLRAAVGLIIRQRFFLYFNEMVLIYVLDI